MFQSILHSQRQYSEKKKKKKKNKSHTSNENHKKPNQYMKLKIRKLRNKGKYCLNDEAHVQEFKCSRFSV